MCGLCPAGGDGGHALHLQADLTAGSSELCDTFESPPLCRGCFKIRSLEVWGIQHSLSVPPLLSEWRLWRISVACPHIKGHTAKCHLMLWDKATAIFFTACRTTCTLLCYCCMNSKTCTFKIQLSTILFIYILKYYFIIRLGICIIWCGPVVHCISGITKVCKDFSIEVV